MNRLSQIKLTEMILSKVLSTSRSTTDLEHANLPY